MSSLSSFFERAFAELDRQLAACRRNKKHGAARIIRAKREALHLALAGKQAGRG